MKSNLKFLLHRIAGSTSKTVSSRTVYTKAPTLINTPHFLRRANITGFLKPDTTLLGALQKEIDYELSRKIQDQENVGGIGPFELDSNLEDSQDVILRRVNGGEEIAITALQDVEDASSDDVMEGCPKAVLMKVCIGKKGCPSFLQFHCRVQGFGCGPQIEKMTFHHTLSPDKSSLHSKYLGPPFSDLDPELQESFVEYLAARGIDVELCDFLITHLYKKEQKQYLQWLHSMKSFVGE